MAEELQISDFDYHLPEELIAQEPSVHREDARLLVVDRTSQTFEHRHVYDLPELLHPQDLLICNNTKVVPARLYGLRTQTGGKWEGLFLKERHDLESPCLELMFHTRGYLQPGEWIDLLDRNQKISPHRFQVIGRTPEKHLLVKVFSHISPTALLEQIGHIPLPHYIRDGEDTEEDRFRYQTVYAQETGSVAAPTAGLHFTPELLAKLKVLGVQQAFVTLHVGIGTFAPMKVNNLNDHVMHAEWCNVSEETARAMNACRGRRIAIGTTSVRTLESSPLVSTEENSRAMILPHTTSTNLFIRPGHRFRFVDAMLSNFHLPRSTLMVLVSAFAGRELIQRAYQEAIKQRYRFFSYGDAMLIL